MKRLRDYFSFSQIKSYLTCPLQYKLKYIDGVETTPTQLMIAGTQTHKNLADILKEKKLEGIPEKAQFIIQNYFYNADEMYIEKEINHELFLYKIKVIIDLYAVKGNTIYLLDWKRNILPENDNQLKLYALILKELNPEVDQIIAWFFATETGFFKRFFYSREELNEFEEGLYATIEQIENDKKFEPNIGSHCSYCPYLNMCLKNKELSIETVNNLIIDSDEKFKDIGEKVLLYEAAIKKVKDLMKEYLVNTGQNEIIINDTDKFYLSYTVTLRSGKVNGRGKKSKSKK